MDKWLRNANVVKVVALVLGILLWVVVNMEDQKGISPGSAQPAIKEDPISNVSITETGFDRNRYFLESVHPSKVSIILRGKESALKRVSLRDYQIVLDLSGYGEGEHTVPLKPFNFPSDVDVEIIPSRVTVKIEEKRKKEVPVVVELLGEPAKGYKAGQPVVNPNRVHVTVPSSKIDQVDSAKAEVNIEGADSAVKHQVKLTAYDKNGKEIDGVISPSVVDVEVPVTSPFKTMPLQIQLTGQTPPGYSIASVKQSADQVIVYGPQNVLDQLEFYDGLNIDLSGLKEDKSFSMDIPLKPKITHVDPGKVEVDIDIVPSETKTLEQVPVTINGQNGKYKAAFADPASGRIDLTIEGAPSLLDKLKVQDVQAIVDVSNLSPGTYELPVNFILPPYVKNASGQPVKVKVDITE